MTVIFKINTRQETKKRFKNNKLCEIRIYFANYVIIIILKDAGKEVEKGYSLEIIDLEIFKKILKVSMK